MISSCGIYFCSPIYYHLYLVIVRDALITCTHSMLLALFSVHIKRPIDKTNFKRKNPFSAYVDSMFNAGVFVNPW